MFSPKVFIGSLILIAVILASVAYFFVKSFSMNLNLVDEDKSVVTHNLVVEKITAIGKLELVKYKIKDIVEHEEIKQYWINSKVVLIIAGEVTGCIDLQKIDSTDITITPDKITIRLPQPEICYFKVDHQQSKVYNIENEYFDQSGLIDKAYKIAEKNLEKAATEMKILEQTKTSAQNILKPLLEGFTGKKVELIF